MDAIPHLFSTPMVLAFCVAYLGVPLWVENLPHTQLFEAPWLNLLGAGATVRDSAIGFEAPKRKRKCRRLEGGSIAAAIVHPLGGISDRQGWGRAGENSVTFLERPPGSTSDSRKPLETHPRATLRWESPSSPTRSRLCRVKFGLSRACTITTSITEVPSPVLYLGVYLRLT
jgi:hypothetical protein